MESNHYVRVEDGKIVDGPGRCPKVWANINGFDHLKPQEQAEHGWFPFKQGEPKDFDPRTQKEVWNLALGPVVTSYSVIEDLTPTEIEANLESERAAMLARNAELRWITETSPLDFLGIPIHMDRDSQITIFAAALRGQGETWKAADGNWYEITAEQLAELSEAIVHHKRSAFAKESTIAHQIKAAQAFEQLDEIDLEGLWIASLSE
jgi:hypothetical protein